MRRFEDFTQQKNRQIRIQYFDQYFCNRENLHEQIFCPRILKSSPAFSVNAGLISDPDQEFFEICMICSYNLGYILYKYGWNHSVNIKVIHLYLMVSQGMQSGHLLK